MIVDEIDAFPYHNNPPLQYAVSQTCTTQGAYILLSATPPEKLAAGSQERTAGSCPSAGEIPPTPAARTPVYQNGASAANI
ncbi:hypothetical protein LJK88_00590 [Paenibacillus sp. P26]|nr:hypothetical protein LJK88_00590 [Paenibacillus sp. P26]